MADTKALSERNPIDERCGASSTFTGTTKGTVAIEQALDFNDLAAAGKNTVNGRVVLKGPLVCGRSSEAMAGASRNFPRYPDTPTKKGPCVNILVDKQIRNQHAKCIGRTRLIAAVFIPPNLPLYRDFLYIFLGDVE